MATKDSRRGFLGSALAVGATAASGCGGAALLELTSAGPRARRELVVAGERIHLEIGTRGAAVGPVAFEGWVRRAAEMVAQYVGRFPVPELRVRVISGGAGGVGFGQHTREGRVIVVVGRGTSARGLRRDAVMVHELMHAAFPRLARRHGWMREGLSTYLETVLRVRAGILSEERMWRTWARSMPRGLSRPGERGLDRTRTWASLYWGGALFWFLCDVELGAQGSSLEAVLRGILAEGGDARQRWPIERVLSVSDEVSGTRVLSERYRAMAARAWSVDLDGYFDRLGVRSGDEGVALSDDAPWAAVRRAIGARTITVPALVDG